MADEQDSNQLTFWGLGFAVLLPLVGFVIGCVLLARRATKAGIVVMVLAVGASVFWFNAYTNHQHNKCMDDNIDRAGSGLPLRDCG